MGLDQSISFENQYNNDSMKWYFRKNWDLHEWMVQRFSLEEGVIVQTLSYQDIEDLFKEWNTSISESHQEVISCCRSILNHPHWFDSQELIYFAWY